MIQLTNGLIIEQSLRATDALARKVRECRHSGPMSNEHNAAGKSVRSSLRARLSAIVAAIVTTSAMLDAGWLRRRIGALPQALTDES